MLDYVKADKAVKNAVIAALVSAGVTAVLSVFTIFTNVEVLPVSPAFFVLVAAIADWLVTTGFQVKNYL